MSEMILLGAGASVETGIPDAIEMTQKMVNLFGNTKSRSQYSRILRFVVGGLLFQKGGKGDNPFDGLNIEDVFNAIQMLSDRETLDGAPFMGSFHPLVDELDVAEPSIYSLLNREGKRSNLVSNSIYDVDLEKEKKVRSGGGKIFKKTNDLMIQKLVDLVWIENSDKITYLLPLFRRKINEGLVIATLNYDNSIELAGQSINVHVETGIIPMQNSGYFSSREKEVSLLKLHGSIDWAWKDIPVSPTSPLKSEFIMSVTPDVMRKEGYRPAVIFGQRNKLTAHGPFLGLLEEFRKRLDSSDLLTVIGYSFRDSHINEYLTQWINRGTGRRIRIINGEKYNPPTRDFAHDLISLKSRVEVLPVNASVGIQQLYGSETV